MTVDLSDEMAKRIKNIAELLDQNPREMLAMIICRDFTGFEGEALTGLYGLLFDGPDTIESGENGAFEVEAVLRAMRSKGMTLEAMSDLVVATEDDDHAKRHEANKKEAEFLIEGENLMMKATAERSDPSRPARNGGALKK